MAARLQRLAKAWGGLDGDQRFAGFAALGLLVTMFLPWYEKNFVSEGVAVEDTISAFGDVSFVEASIFLVSAGVFVLILARGEGRAFHLPGGDGTVIFAAGAWATLLIFYRVFDKPDVSGDAATVGIQWGFFVAFVAAGLLALAGHRMRLAGRPEPPLDEAVTNIAPAPPEASPRPRRSQRAGTPQTAAARSEAAEPEATAETAIAPRRRRRDVTREDAEQLTFDPPARDEPFDEQEPPARLQPGEIPSARRRER